MGNEDEAWASVINYTSVAPNEGAIEQAGRGRIEKNLCKGRLFLQTNGELIFVIADPRVAKDKRNRSGMGSREQPAQRR